jgi:polyhydroxybutyrate depolymerase
VSPGLAMQFHRTVALMVILVLFAGATLATDASARNRSSVSADRQYLVHDGIERSYVVRLPPGHPRTGERLPLVLVLHGGGGNAAITESMTGFTAKARAEGFIVVYPEGTGRLKGKLLAWNAKHCCGHAMENAIDDVGFISDLLDRLTARYPVDPRRIYVTGMSNGAMMAHRLGIELSDRLAAVATVVGTLFGDEPAPAHAVSALIINGMLDRNVPHAGGPPGGRFSNAWDGTPTLPSIRQATFWASADHCTTGVETRDQDGVVHLKYLCPNGKAVESYLLADSGHAWPGGERGGRRGDAPSTSLNATDVIWDFFRAHVK